MIFVFVVLFVVMSTLEITLDASQENRIINPIIAFVLSLLASPWFLRAHENHRNQLQIVHIVLYIACLIYLRCMVDYALRWWFLAV
jgi:hypothetical protein